MGFVKPRASVVGRSPRFEWSCVNERSPGFAVGFVSRSGDALSSSATPPFARGHSIEVEASSVHSDDSPDVVVGPQLLNGRGRTPAECTKVESRTRELTNRVSPFFSPPRLGNQRFSVRFTSTIAIEQ